MALFIVLVLVLVLTIVIFQLTFTTKIEERISRNRQGFLEMSYTLQAVARSSLQVLESDLMEDLGYVAEDGEGEEDGVPPLGNPGSGPPDRGSDPGSSGGEGERLDSRHEEWAHLQNENLNEVEASFRILDGEARIDLNHLFEYAQPEEEEIPEGDDVSPELPAEDEEELDPLEALDEEYVPPTVDQIEDAELILSRLIQALIVSNEEAGFDYFDVPDADSAAREIVNWVQARQAEPETRVIRSLDGLRIIPEVTWELLHGPRPPEEDEEEFEEDRFDDPFGQFAEDLGEMPGFEQFEEGVAEIPRPLGLRDVLTTHSSGKINLNTARLEVLIALMLRFEDVVEAREIATQLDEHLNSYAVADEDEPLPAGDPGTEEEGEGQEFNIFSSFDMLSEVDETWSEGSASEDSILDLLRADLEEISVYHSTYFTVRVEGEREDRKLSGTMEVVREEEDIIVLSWEEADR